jgi:hypothetical protein
LLEWSFSLPKKMVSYIENGPGQLRFRELRNFSIPFIGKIFFLLVTVQSSSGAKIISYPYGKSGVLSINLKCFGLKIKFEH